MKRILLLQILLVCLLKVQAQEGTLDPTFGNNGVRQLGINYNDVAFQSDGKMIGVFALPGGFYLNRYDNNGNLDPSFCCGGTVTLIPEIIGTPSVSVAIQNNNNIVVAVQAERSEIISDTSGLAYGRGTGVIAFVRFETNGALDNTFGSAGIAIERDTIIYPASGRTKGASSNRRLSLFVVQDDGKIVAAKFRSDGFGTNSYVTRYNDDGSPDNSFTLVGLNDISVGDIVIASDGKIVIGAQSAVVLNIPFVIVKRVNSDGTSDPSFSEIRHREIMNFGAIPTIFGAIAVQSDGKIIVASSGAGSTLRRYSTGGAQDSTFGTNGVVNTFSTGIKIILQQNGKIIVAQGPIGRYNPDGSIDSSFGIDGFTNPVSVARLAIAGNRLYAYGDGVLTAFQLTTTCMAPTFLNDERIVLHASCGGNDGNVSVIPTSGIPPFQYSKDGGVTYTAGTETGYTFDNLAVGIYNLRLKDATGCESAIVQKEVRSVGCTTCTAPTFLNNDQIVLNANCGMSNGNLSIIPISGISPFMYSKDGGSTYVAGAYGGYTFENLTSGLYQLRLKDATGCESVVVQREVQSIGCPSCKPPVFLNNDQIVLAASCGNNDGNISIIPTSGIASFMYSINGGSTYILGGDAGYTFENLTAGVYQLRLKDATGCESSIVQREVMNRNNCAGIAATSNLSEATLSPVNGTITTYPNPSRGQFRLQLQNFTSSKAEILVFDSRGSVIHKRPVNITGRSTFDFDLSERAKGVYYIKIVSKKGIKFSKVLLQ